ncbi:DNA-binding protein [Paenibacillus sp. NRS-1782]|uniref:DNA-binding protein n=1 Tax=unclassified Paenibacillus TaxID=185978 RepID=UPI003D2AFDB1
MEDVLDGKGATYLLSNYHHNLDKCVELLHLRFTQHNWNDIIVISDYLHKISWDIYESRYKTGEASLDAERPLIFYYGFSYLAKATALQKLGLFDEAREYILKYSELGWFSGLDATGLDEVERFRFFAKANMYTNDLLSGKIDVLQEYVQFLENNDEEVLPGLVTIMEAANLHLLNVDDVLHKFQTTIDELSSLESETNKTHYFRFLYHLAIYYSNNKRFEDAVRQVLVFLTTANMIENGTNFKKFIVLFEALRQYASNEQIEKYQNLFKELIKDEKIISFDGYDIRSH